MNANTVYDCIVSYKDKMTGNWKLKTKTAPNITKAKKLRAAMVTEVKDGFTQPSKVTLSVFLKDWLEVKKTTWSENTYTINADGCRLHICPMLGDIPLMQLKREQIQNLQSKCLEKLSPRTVEILHITLRQALSDAVKNGIIAHSPMEGVAKPKVERPEMKTLDENDIAKFLEQARKTDYHALFFTMLFSGARRGECLGLKWSDINWTEARLSINRQLVEHNNILKFKSPKTASSRRQIDLTPMNCVVLKAHREEVNKKREYLKLPLMKKDDLIFAHIDGQPYNPHLIDHVWRKITSRCGITGISLHTGTRHSHASLLLKQGVHPKVVQERLGHSSIVITMDIYSHVAGGLGKAAAAGFDDAVISRHQDESTKMDKAPVQT
jgi:integrase